MRPVLYQYHPADPIMLELHALRALVGNYLDEYADDAEAYDWAVQNAIREFEAANNIKLFQMGRSGRHICIEDTPRNRRRHASLQRKAVAAATTLWASMRTT